MTPLWNRLSNWFRSNAAHLTWTPVGPTGVPVIPHDGYFRVWLVEAFLARDRDFLKTRYPSVHASVQLHVAGTTPLTTTSVSRPPENGLGPGSYGNYALTGLLPYRGGTVELQVGLTTVEGASPLAAGFEVLQSFSTLVGPPLSESLAISTRIAAGVERLLTAGNDDVVLGLHETFVSEGGGGGHALRDGYWALVNAPPGTISATDLSVEHDVLNIGQGDARTPLRGYDYLLLRIEQRRERDDWRFDRLEQLIERAVLEHFAGHTETYERVRSEVLAAVLTSDDLTPTDRQRAAAAIREQLDAIVGHGLQAAGSLSVNLTDIVAQYGPPAHELAASMAPTLADSGMVERS
jgi:hypothetical protein